MRAAAAILLSLIIGLITQNAYAESFKDFDEISIETSCGWVCSSPSYSIIVGKDGLLHYHEHGSIEKPELTIPIPDLEEFLDIFRDWSNAVAMPCTVMFDIDKIHALITSDHSKTDLYECSGGMPHRDRIEKFLKPFVDDWRLREANNGAGWAQGTLAEIAYKDKNYSDAYFWSLLALERLETGNDSPLKAYLREEIRPQSERRLDPKQSRCEKTRSRVEAMTTAALRDEIKKTFFPFAAEKGFTRDKGSSLFFVFRKVDENGGYVFDIQFEKYHKPRFVVNHGSCGVDGVTLGGRHIAASDIQPSDTPNFARLKPGAGGGTNSWFRQDRSLLKSLLTFKRLDDPAAPVALLMKLFAEAEEYLYAGTRGPHIYPLAFKRS